MALTMRIVSSMEKLLPGRDGAALPTFSGGGMFSNECLSFQVLLRKDSGMVGLASLRVLSPLAACVRLRQVCCSPVRIPVWETEDTGYLSKEPGLFPDLLRDIPDRGVALAPNAGWTAVLVTVEPMGRFAPGRYPLTVEALCEEEAVSGTVELSLLEEALPEQKLLHTEWFHGDCLADIYHCDVFSSRWWEVVEQFMASARRMGINMLFTPLHTPPLDTPIGGERKTVQLLDISLQDGIWQFDFSRLDRWLGLAKKLGFRAIECSHFFTQWGAAATPKVIVRVDGEEKQLFGWDVPWDAPLYWSYLEALLPKLIQRCEEDGFPRGCQYYHLSDEPSTEHLARYTAISRRLRPLLQGVHHMDALSSVDFYREGAVEVPIPAENHLLPFIRAGVEPLWTYYCCGQYAQVPNRFLAMPGVRTRIQGVLFWKYRIAGLLQWGFNFYYAQNSLFLIDPFTVTDSMAYPAGDPFIVYPGEEGPLESLRYVHMMEALQDMRAMELLESRIGREEAEKLLDSCCPDMTWTCYPGQGDILLALRDRIHKSLQENIPQTKKEAIE